MSANPLPGAALGQAEAMMLPAPDKGLVPFHRWPLAEGVAPRARLLFVHGRGEHGGRYEPVAAELAAHRIECAAVDLPGFGRTVGGPVAPGRLRRFEEYHGPIEVALAHLVSLGGGLPTFVLGHSMGGLAAIRLLEERGEALAKAHRVKGLILSGPFLSMPKPLGAVKRLVVGLIAAVSPDKPLPSAGTPNSRDGARWKAYVNDPLTVKAATARWLTEMLAHQPLALERAKRIPVPVLVLQGGADTATEPAVSRRFAEACGGTYKEYAGFLHEVLNEPEADRARVVADLVAWVEERLR